MADGLNDDAGDTSSDVGKPSPDLPYELQSKLFEQLATMGIAGAGLVITLKGSILSDAASIIWMAAIYFGLAAVIALAAQMSLIRRLVSGDYSLNLPRLQLFAPLILLGMGIGTLGTSVFLEDAQAPRHETDKP